MALADLLYRCPACGHDPTTGEGDVAQCPECGMVYERGRGDLLLLERPPGGSERQAPVSALVARIEAHGGPLTRATGPDGSVGYEADVMVSWRQSEDPVRYRGQLRGYSETMGEPAPAVIRADDEAVHVVSEGSSSESWPFLEIRALQTSSSSLQLSLPGDRLVQFKFLTDSPRRWEDLLRHLVREAHRRAGNGFVVEFQPRIVTRQRT